MLDHDGLLAIKVQLRYCLKLISF